MIRRKTSLEGHFEWSKSDSFSVWFLIETQNTENFLSDYFLNSSKNNTQLVSFYMHRSMDNLEYWSLVLSLNPVWERLLCNLWERKDPCFI